MQNFRTKAHSIDRWGKMAVAAMLSVAMAAVIFWGLTRTGNTDKTVAEMSIAQTIRASGDTLSASLDTDKFTGTSIRQTRILLEEEKGRADVLSEEEEQEKPKKKKAEPVIGEEDDEDEEEYSDEDEDDEDEDEPKRFLGAAGRDGAVTVKTVVEDQVIEHEVINRETSLLAPGKTKLVQSGSDGKKTVTYEQRMVGREIRKKKVIDEQIHQQPVTEITLTGVEGKAVSPLDFGIELDENGVPTEYSKLLTNQVAAGYNVEGGARGASGQGLSAGYVAVHPGEIPYGTKMYITSADNSFVYGFAVAADTGVGLMNDVIDVDLYYDTFLESCLNGKRNVNIYILD